MATVVHKLQQGTVQSWKASGGTYTLTLTSLTSTSVRNGAKGDLGAKFAEVWGYRLTTKFGSNPTDGTLLRIFMAYSDDNTNFSGTHGGTDAAGVVDSLRNMAELAALVCDNLTTTQSVVGTFRPRARYLAPAVYNDATGQSLSGTAGDHELIIWPLEGVSD